MSVSQNRPDAGAAHHLQHAANCGLTLGTAPEGPSLLLAELRSTLAMLVSLSHQLGATLGTGALEEKPKLLMAEEFAMAYGDVKAKTVEDWCRDGRFPFAICRQRTGWRIPEFYLFSDHPPAHLAKWFPVSPTREKQDTGADASSPARPEAEKTRVDAIEAPSTGQSAAATEPAPKRTTSNGFDVHAFDRFRARTATSGERPDSRKSTRTGAKTS